MKVTININTNTDAFHDDPGTEMARILRWYADEIEYDKVREARLRDINGNSVGDVVVSDGGE